MKKPTHAPAYVAMFPVLSEIAQANGYALAIHGSVQRDFDLVAIPWTNAAKEPFELVTAIAKTYQLDLNKLDGNGVPFTEPEVKPHGRLAWFLPLQWAGLDLSIMPRQMKEGES